MTVINNAMIDIIKPYDKNLTEKLEVIKKQIVDLAGYLDADDTSDYIWEELMQAKRHIRNAYKKAMEAQKEIENN